MFDVVQILRDEIGSVKDQHQDLCNQFANGNAEDPAFLGAIEELSGLIDRLGGAVGVAGFPGVLSACTALNELLLMAALAEPEERASFGVQLAELPQLIMAHVEAPTDPDHAMGLAGLLALVDTQGSLGDERLTEIAEQLALGMVIDEEMMAQYPARATVASAEDVSIELHGDIAPNLLQAYLSEAPTHALDFSRHINAYLADHTATDELTAAKRIAHTLKGSSHISGIRGIGNIAHQVEDILEFLEMMEEPAPPSLAATLVASADCMESMLEAVQGLEPPPPQAQQVLQSVLDWANKLEKGDLSEPEGATSVAAAFFKSASVAGVAANTEEQTFDSIQMPATKLATESVVAEKVASPSPTAERVATPTPTPTPVAAEAEQHLRVTTRTMDEMLRLTGEVSLAVGRLQEQLQQTTDRSAQLSGQNQLLQQRIAQLEEQVNIRGAGLTKRRTDDPLFDPLEFDEYSELASVTNALSESATDSRQIGFAITQDVDQLRFVAKEQDRLIKELQDRLLTTRMAPVKDVVPRLQRSIRQTSQATGKPAVLTVEGEESLLDGDVLNRLMDPLLHLIRNAVDHGLESPAERFDAGKPEVGSIKLSFKRVGPNLSVSVSDDGPGLNFPLIRYKAISKGLLGEDEVISDDEAARLILLPGFSTRDQVTEVSGRGVGMDVVRERIMALKGTLNIHSKPGVGTSFDMRIPASLLAIHALIVTVRGDQYAIPSASIKTALPRGMGVFSKTETGIVFTYADQKYPALEFASLVNHVDLSTPEALNDRPVVIVDAESGAYALSVDVVNAARELLARGLGNYLRSVRGVSTVSLMANGSVIPIIDTTSLISAPADQRFSSYVAQQRQATRSAGPSVLVVDDSLSVRRTLAELLEDAGYRVQQASDGLEAANMIAAQPPHIVLTDMEMPRMNGLELASHIRLQPNARHLPVIMITSRSTQKHREQAKASGVSRFVTKPYSEAGLLRDVAELLANVASTSGLEAESEST